MSFVVPFTVCLVAMVSIAQSKSSCLFADFPRIIDVDFNKLYGIWYQVRTSPWTGSDVAERFTVQDDGVVKLEEAGRFPDEENCSRFFYNVTSTGTPGQYRGQDVEDPEFVADMIVLDTDYSTYYVAYVCSDIADSGECAQYLVSLYTSHASRTVGPKTEAKLNKIFKEVCIDLNSFQETAMTGDECIKP